MKTIIILCLFSVCAFALTSSVCIESTFVQSSGDTIQVTATLVQYRLEKDGDTHLILNDSGCTMIAELIDTSEARRRFDELIRKPTSRWKQYGGRVRVTGIRFYDHEHGVKGAAGNNVEIHPVTKFELVK